MENQRKTPPTARKQGRGRGTEDGEVHRLLQLRTKMRGTAQEPLGAQKLRDLPQHSVADGGNGLVEQL